MNHSYDDITSRIPDPPLWWDENAVPRWCTFAPSATANIYCDECCLLRIACQTCGTQFDVCISRTKYQTFESARTLTSYIVDNGLHYGDPPNTGCCAAGPTMNSVPLRVIEYWTRRDRDGSFAFDWRRDESYEVEISPDWIDV